MYLGTGTGYLQMNFYPGVLTSDENVRRLNFSDKTSSSSLGLGTADIFTAGLVSRPSEQSQAAMQEPSLGVRVFSALAAAKIWTSQVAMHIDLNTRDRYFRQLDLLHDADEWMDDESPVQLSSYKGFIRFMLMTGSPSKPSLALSAKGALMAVWEANDDRLTIEFDNEHSATWIVNRHLDGDIERAGGSTKIVRLSENLTPYTPEIWLGA